MMLHRFLFSTTIILTAFLPTTLFADVEAPLESHQDPPSEFVTLHGTAKTIDGIPLPDARIELQSPYGGLPDVVPVEESDRAIPQFREMVALQEKYAEEHQLATRSKADGSFTLKANKEDAGGNHVFLICVVPGYVTGSVLLDDFRPLPNEKTIDFTLHPSARVSGKVINGANGKPVAHVDLRFRTRDFRPVESTFNEGITEVKTRKNGTYDVDLEGDTYIVRIDAPGKLLRAPGNSVKPLTVENGHSHVLDISVFPTVTVEGIISTPERMALPEKVRIFALKATPLTQAEANEGNEGWHYSSMNETDSYKKRDDRYFYRVQGIEAGVSFVVNVLAPGFMPLTSTPLSAPAGGSTLKFNATLGLGHSIEGVVKREDGTPAAKVTLRLLQGSDYGFSALMLSDESTVVSGPDGAFTFQHLPPGRYKIEEEPVGSEGLIFDNEPKQEPIVLEGNKDVEGAVVVLSAPPAKRYHGGFSPR